MTEEIVDLDFEVFKEPWNKYQLLDGTRVRIKHIVQKIRKISEIGKIAYEVTSQDIISVYHVPSRLRGSTF
jgi:hypothetical protein